MGDVQGTDPAPYYSAHIGIDNNDSDTVEVWAASASADRGSAVGHLCKVYVAL